MTSAARLTYDGKTLDLPVTVGSEGETAINISALRKELGLITMDPGFVNTGSCESAVTFINGEEGILRYRGYPIDDLAENSNFLEVCWLLLQGELPGEDDLKEFTDDINVHTMLHEDIKRFISAFPKDAHPMAICGAVVNALSTFYQDYLDPKNDDHVKLATRRLLAKLPTIAAYAYKHSIGQPFMYPRNDLDYCSNFMHLMYGTPCEEYLADPVIAKALDMLLILHADHEQNCSTSTVRLVGSSQVNMFASISAGISALWGPLHGGANQAVIEMLRQIEAEGSDGKKFLEACKDKSETKRLMGFGHRVYKNFDPRAKIIKKACSDVLARTNRKSRMLDIAIELEEAALNDDYFISRKLYPNVDFYSGIIYQAIGIPVNMFTVMFVMGRLPGWIAQWREMQKDPSLKIGRPRQVYTGATERKWVGVGGR